VDEQENPYIKNIFEPRIEVEHLTFDFEHDIEPITADDLAGALAITAHCNLMGGMYIITKVKDDVACFYMTSYSTGKRYKITVEEE
jgi:hypothetical protein